MMLIMLLVWLIRMAVLMLMLSLVVTALLLVLMPAEPALMLDYLVMLALAGSGSQLGLLDGVLCPLKRKSLRTAKLHIG
jgi:hypothetical protein